MRIAVDARGLPMHGPEPRGGRRRWVALLLLNAILAVSLVSLLTRLLRPATPAHSAPAHVPHRASGQAKAHVQEFRASAQRAALVNESYGREKTRRMSAKAAARAAAQRGLLGAAHLLRAVLQVPKQKGGLVGDLEWEAAIRAAEGGGDGAAPRRTEGAVPHERSLVTSEAAPPREETGRALQGERHPHHDSGAPAPASRTESKLDDLLQDWSQMYALDKRSPPDKVLSPKARTLRLPWAPHLEECVELTRRREEAEQFIEAPGSRDARGISQEESEPKWAAYPEWACARDLGFGSAEKKDQQQQQRGRGLELCDKPKPPWVRGVDEGNLPLTRVVQRDLWVHQFPPNCSAPGLRFLLVDWTSSQFHGIGSQIHVMSVALSFAYATRRILVPVRGTFTRANHIGCQGWGKGGTLECYFFPTTSKECLLQAWTLYETHKPKELHVTLQALNSSSPVLRIRRWGRFRAYNLEATAALAWGRPWAKMTPPYELMGRMNYSFDDKVSQAIWWRSQSVRFLLRRPSAYLCHLTNRARHQAYSRNVAEQILATQAAREAILNNREAFLDPKEPERLLYRSERGGEALELAKGWRLGGEAYMPRPIVSMHVRQGDKGQEMKLFSFPAFMWLAERVRTLVPNLHYIWLSTEMQSVIDQTKLYPDWTFLYTRLQRQTDVRKSIFQNMKEVGEEREVGNSFANLILASECDYFVGVLGSNWNRLINELRLTNGRAHTKYFTLNFAEW